MILFLITINTLYKDTICRKSTKTFRKLLQRKLSNVNNILHLIKIYPSLGMDSMSIIKHQLGLFNVQPPFVISLQQFFSNTPPSLKKPSTSWLRNCVHVWWCFQWQMALEMWLAKLCGYSLWMKKCFLMMNLPLLKSSMLALWGGNEVQNSKVGKGVLDSKCQKEE